MDEAALLYSPRLLDIGGGAVRRTAALCRRFGISHPLIVTDPYMIKSKLICVLTDTLSAASIEFAIFSDTVADPTDEVVDVGVELLNSGNFDAVIAFGGGSPIDTAKAINILAHARRTEPSACMRDYKMPELADHAALPLIAIPTTAGTGSEVTRFTVITDIGLDEKMLISGLGALPIAAIVDYQLTLDMPPRLTADTGIDSFTHALEAFVSRHANANSDLFARSALSLIGTHLKTAYTEPHNHAAREAMMLGATHAGIACSIAPVALVHGMARPIGAHFHVPHGLSNAMMLPAVTAYSLRSALPRYAEVARLAGFATASDNDEEAGLKLVEGLREMNRDLTVPSPRAYGINPDGWHAKKTLMAEQALASGSPANNPKVPTKADIETLYEQVFE
ncbi:iron-containing alcohol dehydrogenase [Paraburkholderia phytofirmans]|uniref:Iron-containing alcohol dehydrogenase n=1 Tax=Paraburkholderia phytofirmans (strain DSM 17436 / LMG 22146 / PsJN) TaxID=398527 RepID=B2T8T3_PARPJ|nr:iron-containing alcohol dehydrogenase [Paraburkholderia phytofirmans]ACD20746.1 iron-containing alcohol dehydrogenase [Paraburkholderia phytofirmans PsJN]